jgi:penicillin-binding protein 1A
MWMAFMKVALADRPNEEFSRPNAPKRALDLPMQPSLDAAPATEPTPKDEGVDGSGAGAPAPATPTSAPATLPNDEAQPAKTAPKPSGPTVPQP